MADAPEETEELKAPGWAAIDRVVGAYHPPQEPHQFTSRRPYDLEGTAPLPAITVWEGRDPDHWLYVTYGLSELFEKTSPDPDVSGFGYELTLRLARAAGDPQPPTWALGLLQGIAGEVLAGHASLDSGHLVDLGAPITAQPGRPAQADMPDAGLSGLLCVPDPLLGKIVTPFGSLLFLGLFGLTSDELADLESWSLERKVGLATEVAPRLLTDPARRPLKTDPDTAHVYRRYATGVMV